MAREDIAVAGNRDAIKGALSNLIDNARQACGDDARIELGAEISAGCVYLTVTDNGQGIAPAVRARLFEPFFTTRPQGTGLGLAVAPSVGNFVLVRFAAEPGRDAAAAAAHLKRQGILVRGVAPYGLADSLRITIGTEALV